MNLVFNSSSSDLVVYMTTDMQQNKRMLEGCRRSRALIELATCVTMEHERQQSYR